MDREATPAVIRMRSSFFINFLGKLVEMVADSGKFLDR
jgi:hypothetical protein